MTYIGIAIRLFLTLIVAAVILTVGGNYGKHKYQAGYDNGVRESIGHPMKYSEMPVGEYTVVEVVEKYQTYIAVVRKDNRATGYVKPEYFFVTDMMPNMMEKNFYFTVGGTQ